METENEEGNRKHKIMNVKNKVKVYTNATSNVKCEIYNTFSLSHFTTT